MNLKAIKNKKIMDSESTLFDLMDKYTLTLRKIGGEETMCYRPIEGQKLKGNETLEERIIKSDVSEDEFKRIQEKGYCSKSCRWENGFMIDTFVRRREYHDEKWLVKQTKDKGSMQDWSRSKGDVFEGKTPEEAIYKAVDYIESYQKEQEEKYRKAGLEYKY